MEPLSPSALDALEALVTTTLERSATEIDAVKAVERGDGDLPFWYVRMDGEAKQHFSAEFTLAQRSLTVESYFMPAPEENREDLFAHLLVRNRSMRSLSFVIGAEQAIYLRGQVDNRLVDEELVDHLLAAVYERTESWFVPAMRIGFASRFNR